MNAYELAEYLDNNVEAMIMSEQPHLDNAANMLRQQADRIAELEKAFVNQRTQSFANSLLEGTKVYAMQQVHVAELEEQIKKYKSIIEMDKFVMKQLSDELNTEEVPTTPQTKPLSDEEMNKAFDYYCETDEGVLRFNYELRKEWKEKELQRWKDAFSRAIEERHGIK